MPETLEGVQFGHSYGGAGRKTYAWLRWADECMTVLVWVGIDQQGMLVAHRGEPA